MCLSSISLLQIVRDKNTITPLKRLIPLRPTFSSRQEMAATQDEQVFPSMMAGDASGVADVLAELRSAFDEADAESAALVAGITKDTDECATSGGVWKSELGTCEGAEWSRISRLLQHAGFAPLMFQPQSDQYASRVGADDNATFAPLPHCMRETLEAVLQAYERNQEALQAALLEAAASEQQSRTHSELLRTTEAKIVELQRSNAALEAQLDLARGRLRQESEQADSAARSAERALGGMRLKVATQTHHLRARDAEVSRLQERLSKELAERDVVQKQRERQVFEEVHRRAARQHSPADSRSLELIGVYEAQRRNMSAEIDGLRASVRQLTDDLRERENLISRKDAFSSWRTPDEGVLLGKLDEAEHRALIARDEMSQMEARVASELRTARLAATEAQRDAEEHRARAAALELDLSARPTIKQWADAQATIKRLRSALPDTPQSTAVVRSAMETHPEQKRGNPVADSADAIRRDREVHELGLHVVSALSPSDMIRLLQDSCRELQLQDAHLLPSALRKMCRALAALPPMEAFIRDVCALTLARGATNDATVHRVPSTKLVLHQLERWSRELHELSRLQDFVTLLSGCLQKRAQPGNVETDSTVDIAIDQLSLQDIAHAVEQLVQQERKAMRALDTFQRADSFVDSQVRLDPSDIISRLCAHFQRLFDLRSVEGMLPKMNELYLFVNEQQNLLKVLRSMLGLRPDATVHALLSALRQTIEMAAISSASPRESSMSAQPEASVVAPASLDDETETARQSATLGTPSNADSVAHDIQSETTLLPQYVAIAADLRKLLHAASILAIVSACLNE